MPVWTFTSGPNKGKHYEGSAADEKDEGSAVVHLQRVKRLLKEQRAWGTAQDVSCRRDNTVLKTHSRGILATFTLAPPSGDASIQRFVDVPVVDESRAESGEPVAIACDVKEGDPIEAKLLSDFTCVFRKMSPPELALRKRDLEDEEKRRRKRAGLAPKRTEHQ